MVFKFTLSKVYSELYYWATKSMYQSSSYIYIGLLTRGKEMSVRSSFQGEPGDLKAEIAGLHTLLDPRPVKRAYIAPAVVVHPGVGGIAAVQEEEADE